jgi:transcriptional regulator with XRE-family HTH domain
MTNTERKLATKVYMDFLRHRLKLTLDVIEKESGFCRSSLSNWSHGYTPSEDIFEVLAIYTNRKFDQYCKSNQEKIEKKAADLAATFEALHQGVT